MNMQAWWDKRIEGARREMAKYFASGMDPHDGVDPRLASAVQHVLSSPGSLVRAVTAYLVALEMGVMDEWARQLACGIEYLHTASLVFDDLPAMDDAKVRRGVACVHTLHGEGIAVLAALALVNRGYTMLWSAIRQAPPERAQWAATMVDERLGLGGVIGGQANDLRGVNDRISPVDVSAVAARKTGDMLRLTLALPAVVGNGSLREIQLLDKIGMMRGLAYQVADDLKDVMIPEAQSGKSPGRDRELGRPNLILSEGFQSGLMRFKRLRRLGDRLQAALPGSTARWGMLKPLRVTLPAMSMVDLNVGGHGGSLHFDSAVGS